MRWVLPALLCASCAVDQPGVVVVHVGTDLLDSEIETVLLEARAGEVVTREGPVVWRPNASFGVLQPTGGRAIVTVTLLSGGVALASSTRAIDTFEHGRTLHTWMFISTVCTDRRDSCSQGQVCGRCSCEPFVMETTRDGAPPWSVPCRTNTEDGGALPDVLAPPDAGVIDAGGSCPGSATWNRSYEAGTDREISFGEDEIFSLIPPVSIEAWVRYAGTINTRATVLETRSRQGDWRIALEGQPARLRFEYDVELGDGVDLDGGPWPNDQWHHVAVQIRARSAETNEVSLYLDGVRVSSKDADAWPVRRLPLFSPPRGPAISLKIDGLHLIGGSPRPAIFTPERVPQLMVNTLGLWSMDEDDRATTARDSACRHHGLVEENSFDDDIPP